MKEKQEYDFEIRDIVTKKEMKQLLKPGQKGGFEKKENFLVTLIKKFQFREYRKRNKKIISHKRS